MYITESLAVDALIEANTQFQFGNHQGPVAVYLCDDCGHYHLTSQGKINERLESLIKEGKLKKMKEAAQWESKFKKR
jgi:hypothetical protein